MFVDIAVYFSKIVSFNYISILYVLYHTLIFPIRNSLIQLININWNLYLKFISVFFFSYLSILLISFCIYLKVCLNLSNYMVSSNKNSMYFWMRYICCNIYQSWITSLNHFICWNYGLTSFSFGQFCLYKNFI